MQGSPPSDHDEGNFLERGRDTGEHISVRLLSVKDNHLLQMLTGPGRTRPRRTRK